MAPIPPPPRRNWTVPLILGIAALVLILVVCVAGTAAAFFTWRSANKAEPSVSLSAPTTPSATPASPAPPKTGADCLVGDWLETNYTGNSNIYGTKVQLSGKGTLVRFTGTEVVYALQNVVVSGTANGDTYEVIHNGSLKMNYVVDDKNIHYSNPQADGTTTWKVNGKTRDTEPIKAALGSETFVCQGNDLRMFGENGSTELKRIVPPGTAT